MKPKRLISLLVAVCMMITMLPLSAVTAFAADTASSTGGTASDDTDTYKYEYTVNNGNATITKFLGPVDTTNNGPYDIEIPSELGGYPVTGLGDYSFAVNADPDRHYPGNPLCSNVHSVTIPQNVKSIGYKAFYECDGLESLTFHGESINIYAFYGCKKLTTLSLGENIETIGYGAFQDCSALTNVTIPQSVTSIGNDAFDNCTKLNSVTIKNAAASIGRDAFSYCSSLTTLKLGENITTIGEGAFQDCTALTEVTIPQNVTSIGLFTFLRCTSLTKLSLGNIETIGVDAFAGCSSLKTITIPDSVTDIDSGAFMFCSNLESITIPEKVTAIKYGTFKFCSNLRTITIPDNVTNIDESAFEACSNLESITIPEKVTAIKSDTFKDCSNLKYIILPAGFKSFEDYHCPAGCVFYYNGNEHAADTQFGKHDELAGHKLLCLCKVTFDAKGGNLTDPAEVPVYKTEKITDTKANDLTAIHDPTRAGYKFTGWYTDKDQLFDVKDTAIMEDITLHAGWEFDPNAPGYHPLTVTGGTVTVKYDGSDVTSKLNSRTDDATGKKTYDVPDGATVTVTLDKTLIPEGMVFDIWSTGKFSLPLGQDYKAESITFTMNTMSSDADIAAQYRDATIEDDGPNVLGTAAIIGTAAVGTAVLGYQAYSLGAEFAGKLMALPYFPSNRSALAMMLWEDAGKPMPESELLYPDVEQEEQDMDLQHAARWAMENELIPDLNDEGTAPEEMKFFPANPVSKLDVLNAWQKAQELKNN